MNTKILFPIVAISLIGCTQNRNLNTEKAHFEYFSYMGNDDCYNQLQLADDEMLNPILSGFYPDPSVCNRGGDYYLVNSTFAFFPGLPIFHSTDLVNWQQIGNAINRPSQFINSHLSVSNGMYAPTIRYNPHNNKFYIVCTDVYGQGNFIISADDPAGSWSDPVLLNFDGIDPSIFFDTDGCAYIVNNGDPAHRPEYESQKAIWMQEFDVNTNQLIGARNVICESGHNPEEHPIWLEGPHLYKIGDYYYLMAAEGGTSINHCEVIFRSRNIWGPYETNPNNPILTQRGLPANRLNPVTNAGHADLFQYENNWYAVFLACRPYNEYNYFNIGRETFMLPVTWADGWPTILPQGEVVPLKIKKPRPSATTIATAMPVGNFSFTEKFDKQELPLQWMFLRVPTEQWWKTGNGLSINLRNEKITDGKQPSFVACRQRHHQFTIETKMNFVPKNENEFAGVALFQSESNNYTFGVTLKDGKPSIALRNASRTGNNECSVNLMNAAELPSNFDGQIILSVTQSPTCLTFSYKTTDNTDFEVLSTNVDFECLSTEKAGGFIGTLIGLYAEK